jgi:hypothetical protein
LVQARLEPNRGSPGTFLDRARNLWIRASLWPFRFRNLETGWPTPLTAWIFHRANRVGCARSGSKDGSVQVPHSSSYPVPCGSQVARPKDGCAARVSVSRLCIASKSASWEFSSDPMPISPPGLRAIFPEPPQAGVVSSRSSGFESVFAQQPSSLYSSTAPGIEGARGLPSFAPALVWGTAEKQTRDSPFPVNPSFKCIHRCGPVALVRCS